MLTDTKVRIFTSGMPGAPSAAAAHLGGLLTILDACLISGFGLRTLDGGAMTCVGNLVSVAMGGHGFVDHSVLTISGAVEPAYNGVHRILVDDNDHFSFEITGGASSPASGTITAAIPPAGWSKPFAGDNVAVYRPADGPRHYLRVDDGWVAQKVRVRAYRTMSDVDTGVGMYPSLLQAPVGAFNWMKPASGTYGWTMIADDKAMHFWCDTSNGQSGVPAYYFGWFKDSYSFDPDAGSLLTAGTYNTLYNTGGDGGSNYEAARRMWATSYVTDNSVNATTEQCSGYLAKSFDGAQDSIPFFMMGYAMSLYNGLGQFNNQQANIFAAVQSMGNTSGSGAAASLRGFTFQAPFVAEPSYQSGMNQLRGTLPFLQCLTLYPAIAKGNTVLRSIDRYQAAWSGVIGYDSWASSPYPRGAVVPLGNWEDVL